jgi:hypothetical protein
MSVIAVFTTAMSSISIAVASDTTASVQVRFFELVSIPRRYAAHTIRASAERTISGRP